MDNGFGSGTGNTAQPANFKAGYNVVKCVATGDNHRVLRIRTQYTTTSDFDVSDVMLIEYQDGMENWDIPYFEGIQSVKTPVLTTIGKNLFDKTKITADKLIVGGGAAMTSTGSAFTDYIPVEAGKTYFRNGGGGTIAVYDTDKNFIERAAAAARFTATANGYIIWNINSYASVIDTMQIEEGSVATEYEPYKSTTVTCNEEVELRGVGDVKDELDLMAGELTQRIGEVVLDGSENWIAASIGSDGTFMRFWTTVTDANLNELGDDILCDRFICKSHGNWNTALECIHGKLNTIHINISVSKLTSADVSGFKTWLSDNPVTVQYILKSETSDTIDISTVDQDGNNTELSTFDDITHVTLSSEGLIPEAELEVATKNEEVLNTMSLEMDGISTTQTTLEETSNTQSENVDATMIATTEIYEQLL